MENYGELLRKKREEKNIDIEKVVRETSISYEYIEALEKEDAGAFPGEAYLTGFLKNYSEYLGLSSDSLLSLYYSKKLQESPVPDGLIVTPRPPYVVPLIIVAALFAGTLIFLGLKFFVFGRAAVDRGDVVVSGGENPRSYELGERTFSGRIYRGDQISVPASSGSVVVTVRETLSALAVETPVGVIYTDLAEEREADIDGDTVSDLIIYVADISDSDASKGAEVRMLVKRGDGGQVAQETDMNEIETVAASTQSNVSRVVLEDDRAYPFTITATFRGSTVFRYRSDNSASEEYYLTNGEIVNVTSNNRIRLWMSNSNAVSFSVVADTHRIDLGVGRAGQVLAEDIRWIRTNDGTYQLVVIELD